MTAGTASARPAHRTRPDPAPSTQTQVAPPVRRGPTCSEQRRVLGVLAGTQVLGGVGGATAAAVSSVVATASAGSAVIGGTAITALMLGTAAASLLVARVAVRAGRRPALALGYGLGAVGAGGAAAAVAVGSWPALLVALPALGAGITAGFAARFAATDLADPAHRAWTLGLMMWAMAGGAVAGPNLAAPAERAASAAGLEAATGPFLLCGTVFGLAAAAVWAGLRPDPLLRARECAGESPGAVPISAGVVWRSLWRSPLTRLALGGIVLAQLVMVGVMSMTPVHLGHGGADLQLVGVVISVHLAGMFALAPVFGRLADRAGRVAVLGLGAGLLAGAATVSAPAGPHDTTLLGVGLVLLGLGWSAVLVAGSTLLSESVPAGAQPTVQGVADATMNLSGAVGAVLAGLIVAGASFGALGLLVALVVVPYLVALAPFARRSRPRAPGHGVLLPSGRCPRP